MEHSLSIFPNRVIHEELRSDPDHSAPGEAKEVDQKISSELINHEAEFASG